MALISRSFRRTFLRPKPLILALFVFLFLDAYITTSSIRPPVRTSTLSPSLKNEKIFIASINRNSEYMLRLYWISSLLSLVKVLGPSNVFVSILESGSQEDTKGALKDLEAQLNELGVGNKISLGIDVYEQAEELAHVPSEEEGREGWIFTGRWESGWEVRRIPYLAKLRNKAMEPLEEMSSEKRFDRVLWINDVVFTTEDVITLLSTRSGSYAAACSLDFSKTSANYYDTFALRDSSGLKTATLSYPYFASSASLRALYQNAPIPVQSCWNGIVAFDAAPFYSTGVGKKGLRFRGVEDSLAKEHVEGSECCLIHADNKRMRSEKGVWLNPNVRVAYNASTYGKVNPGVTVKADITDEVHGFTLPGGRKGKWPGAYEAVWGVWTNRWARWVGWVKVWSESRVVRKRVERWIRRGLVAGEQRKEVGRECLVNEMQVLYQNGWMHL